MRKKLTILVVLLVAVLGFVLITNKDNSRESFQNPQSQNLEEKKPETIRIIANGDLLPHDSINKQAKTSNGYEYTQFFSEVKDVYQSADIRFCNQEATTGGEALGISGFPVFNAPQQFARDISAVGCNVINLANNHANDKGLPGISSTRQIWDELKPLAVAGANRTPQEQAEVAYFEVKGVRFAFVAYTELSNNKSFDSHQLNTLNKSLVESQLKQAEAKADITLVSVHWGTEYSPRINAAQETWSKSFADLGADIVLGTGPHVLEPVKLLPKKGGGETIVYYSLGNLLSTQLDIESLIGGFAVLDIDPKTKQVISIGFLPTYMHYEWTPEQKAREDLLSRKNIKIYPLVAAAEPLSRSQNNTTVQAQTKRVTELLNQFTKVKIYQSLN